MKMQDSPTSRKQHVITQVKMPYKRIRIGTRGSRLALVQAESVKNALERQGIIVDLVTIKTKGDRILNTPLAEIGGKGLFIREIEESLLNKNIDIAVHSLKDLPAELPDGLTLGAVLERGDARDALVSRTGKTLREISVSETIATSSLRRKAQLLHYNPDFTITDMRGNIDTRLRKLEGGSCEALVLAGCGLVRAGFAHKITELINPELIVPAACQGIVGIEIRKDDAFVIKLLRQINHVITYQIALAEREFLRTLGGSCRVPVGCISGITMGVFAITGLLADAAGKKISRKKLSGHPVKHCSRIFLFRRYAIGLFCLSENLIFPQNKGVQSCGNPKQMIYSFFFGKHVKMYAQIVCNSLETGKIPDQMAENLFRKLGIDIKDNFRSVAC